MSGIWSPYAGEDPDSFSAASLSRDEFSRRRTMTPQELDEALEALAEEHKD